MTIEALKERLPDYARDLKLNLSGIATEPGLTEQQRWGTILASALASRNAEVIKAIGAEAAARLTPEAIAAVKTAAARMAMNNIYYRFLHLVATPDYKTMPARLRMNALAKPGVDKADFELWALAVSAINGCGMCLEAHEHEVRKAGLDTTAVQNAVRIASIIHAVAATLGGEAALAG